MRSSIATKARVFIAAAVLFAVFLLVWHTSNRNLASKWTAVIIGMTNTELLTVLGNPDSEAEASSFISTWSSVKGENYKQQGSVEYIYYDHDSRYCVVVDGDRIVRHKGKYAEDADLRKILQRSWNRIWFSITR